eukprot:909834-Prymnesium_polylepis.1
MGLHQLVASSSEESRLASLSMFAAGCIVASPRHGARADLWWVLGARVECSGANIFASLIRHAARLMSETLIVNVFMYILEMHSLLEPGRLEIQYPWKAESLAD